LEDILFISIRRNLLKREVSTSWKGTVLLRPGLVRDSVKRTGIHCNKGKGRIPD
jgi:hypothetical protein